MTDQPNINESLGKLRTIESQLCALLVEREEVVHILTDRERENY